MKLLSIAGLHAGYGDNDILHGIDLDLEEREIITIAGTNGAGKSTLSKAVLGLLPRLKGTISLAGVDLTRVKSEERIAHGIGYVPQVNNVFGMLTVQDNLKVVCHVRQIDQRIAELLEVFPALKPKLRQPAGTLSGGERQMLAFARALMGKPRLIVLDEPTAALSPGLVEQVFEIVRALPSQNVGVFMVEQRARQALAISSRGYILDQGRLVLSGSAAELLGDDRMARLYLGGGH